MRRRLVRRNCWSYRLNLHWRLPRWVRLRQRYLIAYPLPSWHLVCGRLYVSTLPQRDVRQHYWTYFRLLLWLLRFCSSRIRVQQSSRILLQE